jgi:hypothetical protein
MKLKKSTKIRVITGEVSFFTTVNQIREGVGSKHYYNSGVQAALQSLEDSTSKIVKPSGIASTWVNYSIQLDIVE